jgi:O-antigen/teichoic acid export membrane protein
MSTQLEIAEPATPLKAREARPADDLGRLRHKAVRGGMLLFGSRLAVQFLTWAITLVVARLLRPEDYGLVTTAGVFVGLADLLAEAGVGKAVVWKKDLRKEDLSQAFTLSLLFSGCLYAVLFLGAGAAGDYLAMPELGPCLRVQAVLLLIVPFRAVPLALLDRGLRFGRQSIVYVVIATLQSAVILGLAVAGFGFWALILGGLAARVVEAAILCRLAAWWPRLGWPGKGAWDLLRFGSQVSGATLLWFLYSNSDFAILGKLAGPVVLGYYALAFQLISMPVQKITALCNQVAYPVFCRLQGEPERMRDWYLRLTALLGLLGAPVLVGMALVAEDAIPVVLGARWLPAVLPFRLLSLVGMVMIVGASLPPLFNALGRPDINLRYTAACAALLPVSFFLLGKAFGVLGVCLAWLVGYPVIVAVLVWSTRRVTGFGLREFLGAQTWVFLALLWMVAWVLLVRWLAWDVAAPTRLALQIVTGVLAYAGCLWPIRHRTPLANLRSLLRRGRPEPARQPAA